MASPNSRWRETKVKPQARPEPEFLVEIDPDSRIWRCFRRGAPYTPVFGSAGNRERAEEVCRYMNNRSSR